LSIAARLRSCTVLVVILFTFAGMASPTAHADGDPASDVLLVQDVFLPFSSPVSRSLASILSSTVRRAHAARFPIKVALIESRIDLGADPELYGTPQRYASFLDIEISYNSQAKLLVVMPQGFGTSAAGPASALTGVHIDAAEKTDCLARAAIEAVVALADRAGHPIAAPALPSTASGGSPPWVLIAPVAIVLLVGCGVAIRRKS
jgi:hypothetical protein